MTNPDQSLMNGPVELGAPTLTINQPSKVEEKSSKVEPKEAPNDDAGNRNQE